jgi:xanthine dehydrogenase small subunit
MSLFTLYLQGLAPSREQVVEALAGNLCRCTGYRPIIDAGCRMSAYPRPQHWGPDAPGSSTRCELLRSVQRQEALRLPGWYAPHGVEELAAALEADPQALLLAGGTDVGLWVTKQLRELPSIIYIGEVREFKRLYRDHTGLTIGAAVPLTDAWSAIVKEWPQLAELAQRFGSPPVRNSGTLCGNIANGSPIGDSLPVLIALGAQLELRRGTHTRCVPLEEFYLGYQRKDLKSAEFVVCVRIPPPKPEQLLASYKVSKRFDQDISAVCAAFAVQLQDGYVSEARIAFGGMAAVPSRAHGAETRLIGARWTEQSVSAAAQALAQDFQPLTDLRASGAYRLQCARNLLHRFFIQNHAPTVALRVAQAASVPTPVPTPVRG